MNLNEALNTHVVRHMMLEKLYLSEFVIIDGLNQHRDGLTFKEWCAKQRDE